MPSARRRLCTGRARNPSEEENPFSGYNAQWRRSNHLHGTPGGKPTLKSKLLFEEFRFAEARPGRKAITVVLHTPDGLTRLRSAHCPSALSSRTTSSSVSTASIGGIACPEPSAKTCGSTTSKSRSPRTWTDSAFKIEYFCDGLREVTVGTGSLDQVVLATESQSTGLSRDSVTPSRSRVVHSDRD